MNKTFLTRISPIALAVHCFTAGAMSSGEYQVGEGRVNNENKMNKLLSMLLCILSICFLVQGNVHAEEQQKSEIEVMKRRLIDNVIEGTSISLDIEEILKEQRDDGSWADVDYASTIMANWPPQNHLHRLEEMSIAFSGKTKHPLYQNHELKKAILRGIDFWFARKPTGRNWWHKIMMPQQKLRTVLLFMEPYVTKAQRLKILSLLQKSVSPRDTGANRVWFSETVFVNGLFREDREMIYHALNDGMRKTIVANDGSNEKLLNEGIQPDQSFTQHGVQLYNNGYGQSYIKGLSLWFDVVRETSFAFSEKEIDTITKLVLDGNRWMMRYHMNDIISLGRTMSRDYTDSFYSSTYLLSLKQLERVSSKQETKDELRNLIAHIHGTLPTPGVEGNRMFWRVDYMTHIRPGYFSSVKMTSKGVKSAEDTNSENILGGLLSYGLAPIMITGNEYNHIYPVWDWALLPGTSSPHVNLKPGQTMWMNETFSGGVSDGNYGTAAMEFSKTVRGKSPMSFSGHISRFFFDNEIVALGANLECNSPAMFHSSINQCLLNGDVYVEGQNKPITKNEKAGDFEAKWVWHDNVGYLFPERREFKLRNGKQSGSWQKINTHSSAPSPVSKDVFSLYIEQGIRPKQASYAYAILPAKNKKQMNEYASNPRFEILSNTSSVQAVRQTRIGVTGIVFYKPGKIAFDDVTVSVDEKCLILVRETGHANYEVSVSNPESPGAMVTVTLKKGVLEKTIKYSLSDNPAFLGKTMTNKFKL